MHHAAVVVHVLYSTGQYNIHYNWNNPVYVYVHTDGVVTVPPVFFPRAMLLFQCFHYVILAAALSSDPVRQNPLRLDTDAAGPESLFRLHRRLVDIESVTGNEYGVAKYLESYLSARNFTVELQWVKPVRNNIQRFNVLAYPGSRNSRILLSTHIDTVPPYIPYSIRNRNEIWGRGSVDAKGCVATQIKAVEELLASGDIQQDDVALLFVVGEETGGDGMGKANELDISWEAVIFGEPTELKLVSGHKGGLTFTMRATGKAGHSGYPWIGENANSMLLPALSALERLELPSSEKYGNSTLNVGLIEGGVGANVLAETARAEIMVRIAANTADHMKKIILDAVQKVDHRLTIDFVPDAYGPVDLNSDIEGPPPHVILFKTKRN